MTLFIYLKITQKLVYVSQSYIIGDIIQYLQLNFLVPLMDFQLKPLNPCIKNISSNHIIQQIKILLMNKCSTLQQEEVKYKNCLGYLYINKGYKCKI